ncbi:hypothetical protein PHLCEN_2v13349, partial [Hermanssonia centrifuga]
RSPLLMERKAARMRKEMESDPEKATAREIRTRFDHSDRHWKQIFAKSLVRPFKLFWYEPIAQLLGAYMAFVYGLLYLFLTTIPGIFERRLVYVGLHTGASQINARFMDRIYMYYTKKNGGKGRPEYWLCDIDGSRDELPPDWPLHHWLDRPSTHTLDGARHREFTFRHPVSLV